MMGDTRERSVMSWVVSARALASVVPSRNRATPMNVKRLDAVARVDWAAIQASVRASENANEGASRRRRSWAVRRWRAIADDGGIPSVAADPQPMREHDRRRLPGTPSWSVNQRPRAGWTRSTDASDGRRAGYLNALGVTFRTRERDAGEVVNRTLSSVRCAIREMVIELPAHVLDAGVMFRAGGHIERDQPIRSPGMGAGSRRLDTPR